MKACFARFLIDLRASLEQDRRQAESAHQGENPLGRKSVAWSVLALAGRVGIGQLLRAVPESARLVMGDLLARWRRGQLARHALGDGRIVNT